MLETLFSARRVDMAFERNGGKRVDLPRLDFRSAISARAIGALQRAVNAYVAQGPYKLITYN